MGTAPDRAYSSSNGCSSRQEKHHDAQTFSTHTLPFISSAENVLDGSLSWANRNAGAALLISGDGISCGSRPRPMARNTISTTKRTSGITNLLILPWRPWLPLEQVVG